MSSRGMAEGRARAGLFEIDLARAELYKNGRKIALQQQPFRVLLALIERPGETVTREELQSKLWPSDTYVAFDEGLNTAIRKLRTAFGDSAENPRFIQTVPRRGYIFIAPLAWEANNPPAVRDAAVAIEEEKPSDDQFVPHLPLPSKKSESRTTSAGNWAMRWQVQALAAAVLLISILLIFSALRPTLPPPQVLRTRQLTRLGDVQKWIYTDGPRLYFSTGPMDDHRRWRSISVEGGASSPADEMKGEWFPQNFSPNGSELLTLRGPNNKPTFWKVSFPSGAMQELDSAAMLGLTVGEATWSPDGQNIVFTTEHNLWIMKNDGSNARRAATFAGQPSLPVWSPDGRKVRVTVDKWAGNFSVASRIIMEVDLVSGTVREMPLNVLFPQGVDWLHHGNYFLFIVGEAGLYDLWAVRESPDGWRLDSWRKLDRHPTRLTSGPISFDLPIVGRDGKTIFAVGTEARGALQIYNRKGGVFEPFLGGLSGDHLVYSRDGQWLAYISYPERALWRCRANGQDCLQLAFMRMHMDGPGWSPDGKQIAFNAKGPGKLSKGYIVSSSGGVPQPLFPDSPTGEERLSWSPDGKQIMYAEVSTLAPTRIRIVDLATRHITDVPDSSGLEGDWSPDGNYLIARDGDKNAKLFDFRAQQWTDLDLMNGDFWWSPDSQYVFFHTLNHLPLDTARDGEFRLRIADRRVEKVMGVPPFKMIGTWGIGTGLTPDNAPLILKDMTTSDLYALDLDLP